MARLYPDDHPFYRAWASMKRRCNNPNTKDYKYYGGRGIGYCASWDSFEGFRRDMIDSWKEGLTLDRKDSDKDYGPGNCRWVEVETQRRNRRNCMTLDRVHRIRELWGEGKTCIEIASIVGVTRYAASDIVHDRSWIGV